MTLIEIAGFVLPLEWVIGVAVAIIVFPLLFLFLLLRRGKPESPVEENMALFQPIDEHENLQPGTLIGHVDRTEDRLIVNHPEWKDDEGNQYEAEVPIEKKVPFTFFDAEKHLKRLWIVVDKGILEAASASTIVKGIPQRWDPPYSDRRKAGRFLVGRYSSASITNALTTKTGIITMAGLIMFGVFMAISIMAGTGHLK